MTTQISRRTLTKGMAWTVPAIAVSSAAPAFAASPTCSPASMTAIDDAFAAAWETYKDMQLTVQFYQSDTVNGAAGSMFINVRNDGSTTVPFTAENPLDMTVVMHQLPLKPVAGHPYVSWEHVAYPPCQPNWTRSQPIGATTSWGTTTPFTLDPTTHDATTRWTFLGNVAPGEEPDMAWAYRTEVFDFWCSGQRYYAYAPAEFCITLNYAPGTPTIESILGDATQRIDCASYYQTKEAAYRELMQGKIRTENFTAGTGWTGTYAPFTPGSTVCSSEIGNGTVTYGIKQYRDGII